MAIERTTDNLNLNQAVEILGARIEKIEEKETVILWDAVRRIIAEDVFAERDQPPFSRSPLDGYAVMSKDIGEASYEHPVNLTVIDEITAGHLSGKTVTERTAVRIMTGAPIPPGADCVIRQEDTDYGEDIVKVYKSVRAYQNYCFQGEDYKTGTRLLAADSMLGAAEIGVLASTGRNRVDVYRRPSVALITTGDEIMLPGDELGPGKIYDSNLYIMSAKLSMWDIRAAYRIRMGDDAHLVANKIEEIVDSVDMIITTGGVSVGKKDIMHDVIRLLGAERIFWKIAIKPGMPTLCAQYKGRLLICLSGNPFGAMVNMDLLVRPLLAKMSGRKDLEVKRICAVSESEYPKMSPVTRYIRAYYEEGKVTIPEGSNDSGILASMCGCNCLIELPAGTERLEKGDKVWVILL